MANSFQKTLNRISRATLGASPLTPIPFLEAEGGSTPAAGRPERKQECYARRFRASADRAHREVVKGANPLATRLLESVGLALREIETVKASTQSGTDLPGRYSPSSPRSRTRRTKGNEMTRRWRYGRIPDMVWTDGSRTETGAVGGGICSFSLGRRGPAYLINERRAPWRNPG